MSCVCPLVFYAHSIHDSDWIWSRTCHDLDTLINMWRLQKGIGPDPYCSTRKGPWNATSQTRSLDVVRAAVQSEGWRGWSKLHDSFHVFRACFKHQQYLHFKQDLDFILYSRSQHFFKGPDSKYFQLCWLYSLCCNYLALPCGKKTVIDNMSTNSRDCVPMKLHL